jgi:hypothetical protein
MKVMTVVLVLVMLTGVAMAQEPEPLKTPVVEAVISETTTSAAPAPVSLEVTPDGSGALMGVDLLAGTNAEGKREQGWWKTTKAGMWKHKWKIAAGVATAVAVDRVAENNDWLYYEGPDESTTVIKETKEPKPAPIPEKPSPNSATQSSGGDSNQEVINLYIEGDGNTINMPKVSE